MTAQDDIRGLGELVDQLMSGNLVVMMQLNRFVSGKTASRVGAFLIDLSIQIRRERCMRDEEQHRHARAEDWLRDDIQRLTNVLTPTTLVPVKVEKPDNVVEVNLLVDENTVLR